jgi:hypothetical protein
MNEIVLALTTRAMPEGGSMQSHATNSETASLPPELVDGDLRSAWIAAVRYFGFLPRSSRGPKAQEVYEGSADRAPRPESSV